MQDRKKITAVFVIFIGILIGMLLKMNELV